MSEATASRWGWAILHRPRDTTGMLQEPTIAVAVTGGPEGATYANGPGAVDRSGHSEPEQRLTAWGWERIGPWRRGDPARLGRGQFDSADEPEATDRDEHQVARVRPAGTGTRGHPPIAYAHDLQWAFDDPAGGQALVTDSNWHGTHYPGWVVLWLQNLDRAVAQPPPAAAEQRRVVADATATFEEFNAWLREQLREHGWPRAGTDPRALAELLLAWVIGYTDDAFRAECRLILADRVAAGDADPDHLAALEATLP